MARYRAVPATFQALAVVILSVVPGTLARAAWSRGKTLERPTSDAAAMVQAVALSLAIQAALAPATFALFFDERAHLEQVGVRLAAWAFVATIVVPLTVGYGAGVLSEWIAARHPSATARVQRRLVRDLAPVPPSAFDWLAATGRIADPSIIIITFRDSHHVAGMFAEGAALVTSPRRQGIFLPIELELDAHTGEPTGAPVAGTQGILIPDLSEVRSLRILEL